MDTSDIKTRKLIQRWIGSEESGDLNDPSTVAELLKDIKGLQEYLLNKQESKEDSSQKKEYKEIIQDSPNKGGKIIPRGVVFHHSEGGFLGTLDWIKNSKSKVSYHVLIRPDGARFVVVPYDRRAWHAGESSWKGKSGCNDFTVGIAFSGDTYKRKLTDDEILSAKELFDYLRKKYSFEKDDFTDHRTVSPSRKDDLNPVEFERLKKAILS